MLSLTQYKKPVASSIGATSSTGRQPMRALHQHYQQPVSSALAQPGRNQVWFYNRGEPYYEFTNFFPCIVFIDGRDWPTTEHYFQAQKFVGTPYVEKIRMLPGPRDAFQLSRDPAVSCWRRSDWESVKDDIMLKALRVKFTENLSLREKLRGTGEKELVEHTSNDSYWGDGGNGLGLNKLGKLLMQVRRELKEVYGPYYPPMYHRTSRDDTSISHRPTSTHTPSRLKRSNSFSNISLSRPTHTSAPSAAYSSSSGNGIIPGAAKLGQTGKNITNRAITTVKQTASRAASAISPVNSSNHSKYRSAPTTKTNTPRIKPTVTRL